MPFDPSKLQAFLAKKAAAVESTQTGGKGSVRRKHKAVRKTATQDDKKLRATLNKLAVRDIPGIEEVNFFKEDGNVVHFKNPKVSASIAANTYVVNGVGETKKLQDLLPGIIQQLGPDNLNELRKIYSQLAASVGGAAAAGDKKADDDEVPDLVNTDFEAVSKQVPK